VNWLKQYTSSTSGNHMYPILDMALNYHVPTYNCTKQAVYRLRKYTFPSLGTYKNQMKMNIIHPVLNHWDNNLYIWQQR
jgi:hypothetical protein